MKNNRNDVQKSLHTKFPSLNEFPPNKIEDNKLDEIISRC